MKKKTVRTAACLLLAATVLTAFAALAGGVGSQDDPLVTLSYLNGTFLDQVLEKVDKSLESRGAQLQKELEGQIAQREQALWTARRDALPCAASYPARPPPRPAETRPPIRPSSSPPGRPSPAGRGARFCCAAAARSVWRTAPACPLWWTQPPGGA